MSSVRILVGTKKGAFVCTSDGKRRDWKIEGPFFGGFKMYHLKASPVEPNRIFASRPDTLYTQKHWDTMRSDNAGDLWHEVSGALPSDFGFPIDVHAHEPETIYVVPIKSDSEHYVPEGKLRVYRSRTGGNEWEALTHGLPQKDCYVNVLREAMAVDTLDECGIYFGTTGGDHWSAINESSHAAKTSR